MFSQFARKVLFSEIKHIYNTLYTVYTRFSYCIRDFRKCSHNSLMGRGFYDFCIFMAYHHLVWKCFSRKLATTQDGKGLLSDNFPLQVIFTLLANSWCPEKSFRMKIIYSNLFGEYNYCWVILIHWIPILINISCVITSYVLQNQSLFRLLLWVMLFLVTATCSLLLIMSLSWLLNFLFVWFLCFEPPDMY